jgi:hypothetical protein
VALPVTAAMALLAPATLWVAPVRNYDPVARPVAEQTGAQEFLSMCFKVI